MFKASQNIFRRFLKNAKPFNTITKLFHNSLRNNRLLAVSTLGLGYNVTLCSNIRGMLSEDDWKFVETDFRSITTDNYERLKQLIKLEFISDPMCVYTTCVMKNKYYFVVMQKQNNVVIDESTKEVVDAEYAQYGANELLVKQIIDLDELCPDINDITTSVLVDINEHIENMMMTRYEVDKMVSPNIQFVDPDLNYFNVIHYFKTIHAGYFKMIYPPENYNGLWFSCHSNGRLQRIIKYKNGKQILELSFIDLKYQYPYHVATLIDMQKFFHGISPHIHKLYSCYGFNRKLCREYINNVEPI
jgi:hypothetical protein